MAPTPDAMWRPRYNPWLIAAAVTLAAFMEILDTTIVNVALRYIAGDLAVSDDDATWVLTSYLVSNGIVLTISGWFGDVLGRKRYFLICIAMFTVFSTGLIAVFLVSLLVEDPPWLQNKKTRGIDYIGLSLITIGLGCLQIMMDRGEDDDWFGSNFIRLMALLAFLGILGAIGWLLIAKKPIVNLMVFKDWHFSIGCLLMAAASGILYASAVAIPQFTQQVLLYTPTWAGLVLSPGGIAIMVLIPAVNALVEIVQTRYVIAFGFLVLGFGLISTSTIITPDVDFRTLMMMRTLQSAGLGFLLVPINTVAFVTLPRELNNDGAALFAMFRNVFGSIGISLATTAITERTQVHQAYLSRWTTPLHQPFETLIATYEQAFRAMGRAGSAVRDDAVGRIYQVFRIQAAVLAYADIFMYAAVIALIMIPLSFLVAPIKCSPKPSPHHAGVRH